MANQTLARAKQPPDKVPSEAEYQAFCAALGASARGRAFLAEYARRNRHADTKVVLAALDRLQTQVAAQTAEPDTGRIRQELRALLAAMRVTRPEIDAGAGAIKATKLAALIGFIEHRLELIVTPPREHAVLPDEVAALVMPEAAPAAIARSALAVVPAAEQPELPIPSPIGALPPMTLVAKAPAPATHAFGQDPAQKPRDPEAAIVGPAPPWQPLFGDDAATDEDVHTAARMPEVALFDSAAPHQPVTIETPVAAPAPAVVEEAIATPPAVAVTSTAARIVLPAVEVLEIETLKIEVSEIERPPAQPAPATPATDLLAAMMALSEDERIALFT